MKRQSPVLTVVFAGLLLFAAGAPAGALPPVLFPHGVASGDVTTKSVTLWTRADQETPVTAEISTDCTFTTKVKSRKKKAKAADDFVVKFRVHSLESDHMYCYRFKAGDSVSEVGTFHTAPHKEAEAVVRFAYSSDSDGSAMPVINNFEVLDRAREDGLDFWVYLGDTVYMDANPPKAETVEAMRAKYKQNRDFVALRDLLRSTSTYAIWDDHEVENDFAGQTVDPVLLANGRRVFKEYMPIGKTREALGFFRTFRWGKNVELFILDERSFRSGSVEEACDDPSTALFDPDFAPAFPPLLRESFGLAVDPPPGCLAALTDPRRTMLGEKQKSWLKKKLLKSTATWKLIITEVSIAESFALPYDRWEGYAAERQELLTFILRNDLKNLVFLTGDLHANFIGDVLLSTFTAPIPIAKEIIAGPIAQETVFGTLVNLLGSEVDALGFIGVLATFTNPSCIQTDAFGYALVEADSLSLTVALKDDTGQVLQDQLGRPGASCTSIIPAQ